MEVIDSNREARIVNHTVRKCALILALVILGLSYWMPATRGKWSLPFELELIEKVLYPLPHSFNFGALIIAVCGCILLGFSIPRDKLSISRLAQEPARSTDTFFPQRSKFIVFLVSSCIYLFFLSALYFLDYSHHLLWPFGLSLLGFVWSLSTNTTHFVRASKSNSAVDFILSLLVFAGVLFLSSRDLLSWYFSAVGDEFEFYWWARRLTQDPDVNIFSFNGAYGKFPVGDSYFTSLFLTFLGTSPWAWKFSCCVVHAATAVIIYHIGNSLWGRIAGVSSSIALGASHYLMAFDRIGYNNTHMCLTSSVIMLLFLTAYQRCSRIVFFVTGIASGLSIYSIWGGLIVLPIVGIASLFLSYRAQLRRNLLSNWMVLASGFVLTATPGLLSNSSLQISSAVLSLNHGVHPFSDRAVDNWSALLTSTLAFFQNDWWGSHYVYGPLVDPITGALALMGAVILLRTISSWQSISVLVWLGVAFLGITLLSRSSTPYITRLLFVLPPLVLLSGRGFSALTEHLSSNVLRIIATVCLLVGVLVLNYQQLYVGSPLKSPPSGTRLLVKEVQNSTRDRVVYISRGDAIETMEGRIIKLFAPSGISVTILSEKGVNDAIVGATIDQHYLRESKIIALEKLSYLFADLTKHGAISGPTIKVPAEQFIDSVIIANASTDRNSLLPTPPSPRLISGVIGAP
jgi:hypothetical protein